MLNLHMRLCALGLTTALIFHPDASGESNRTVEIKYYAIKIRHGALCREPAVWRGQMPLSGSSGWNRPRCKKDKIVWAWGGVAQALGLKVLSEVAEEAVDVIGVVAEVMVSVGHYQEVEGLIGPYEGIC